MLLGKSCKGFDFKKVESPEAASVVMRDVSGWMLTASAAGESEKSKPAAETFWVAKAS